MRFSPLIPLLAAGFATVSLSAAEPVSLEARGLAATKILRSIDQQFRDPESLSKLRELLGKHSEMGPGKIPPVFVAALAEYLMLLERFEEAEALLSSVLAKRATPEIYYQAAVLATHRGNPAKALELAQQALPPGEFDKNGDPRYLFLAAELRRDGRAEAIAKVFEAFPDFMPAVMAQANVLKLNRDYAGAAKLFRRVLGEDAKPEAMHIEARRMLAFCLIAQDKFAESFELTKYHGDKHTIQLHLAAGSKLESHGSRYQHLFQGFTAAETGQHKEAINFYVEALEKDRTDYLPFLLLAQLYEKMGDHPAALDRWRKAWAADEKSLFAASGLLRALVRVYEVPEANAVLAKAESRFGKANFRLERFLIAELERRPYDELDRLWEESLKRGRTDPAFYVKAAEWVAKSFDYESAEFYYSRALQQDPENSEAVLGLALMRAQIGSPEAARLFLEARLSREPASSDTLTSMAMLSLRTGDQPAGKKYLQDAIRANSNNARAFMLLGDLTKEEGNRQKDYNAKRHSFRYALASYEMAAKLRPSDPEAFAQAANLYFDIRDLGAAAKNYHKVLSLVPRYPQVRLRLAQIARNGGEGGRAIELLKEEIAVNPQDAAPHVERGNIAMAHKDFALAEEHFLAAAGFEMSNADARFGLGVIKHLQGKFKPAIEYFEKTKALDPLKADVHWQLGLVYQKQAKWAEAMTAFENYKGIVREPAAISKADDKLRELSAKVDPIVAAIRKATQNLPKEPVQLENRDLFDLTKDTTSTWRRVGDEFFPAYSAYRVSGGKTVSSRFVEFQVPADYECSLEYRAFVCQSRNQDTKRDRLITVKSRTIVPGEDELPVFKTRLAKPMEYQSLMGESIRSEVKFVRDREIAAHQWVEAMHLDGEVPDFVTRYLVTREGGQAILVALSVRKDKYQDYFQELDTLAASLKAFDIEMGVHPIPASARPDTVFQMLKAVAASPDKAFTRGENAKESEPGEWEEKIYAQLLAAHAKRDFVAMHAEAGKILAYHDEFRDTVLYRDSGRRGLEEIAAAAARKKRDESLQAQGRELSELEEKAKALVARSTSDPVARLELDKLVPELYVRDPYSRAPASWNAPTEEK